MHPRRGSRSHAYHVNKRQLAYACAQKAALGALLCVIAVPAAVCACAWFGCCKLATGHYPRFGCSGCSRNRRGKYYTEEEWKALKRTPEPEVIQLWKENDDNYQGRFPEKFVHVDGPRKKDKRTRSKSDQRHPFRFLDLPKDIQLMVLDCLVLRHSGQVWDAVANYCRDGFIFHHKPTQPKIVGDKCVEDKNHNHVWSTREKYVVYRTNYTATTRALVLTSRGMHNLTFDALVSSFSGTLRFEGRERTSLLDEKWAWYDIGSYSPIVTANSWLLNRVRVLETPHYQQVWPEVLEIMPSLEHIKLIPRQDCRLLLFDARGRETSQPNSDLAPKFMQGDFDDQIVQRCLEFGRRWMDLVGDIAAEYNVVIKVSVFIKYRFGGSWWTPDQLQCPSAHVEMWPETGKFLLKSTVPGRVFDQDEQLD